MPMRTFREFEDLGEFQKMKIKKRKNSKGLEALARKTITFAKSQVILDKTEADLEEEIRREETAPPKAKLARFRHKGERLMHTKSVLLMIVILNIVDCILVLGELMLDIHYVKDLLEKSEASQMNFLDGMKAKYPVVLHDYSEYDMEKLYSNVLHANVSWNHSYNHHNSRNEINPLFVTNSDSTNYTHAIHRRDADYTNINSNDDHDDDPEVEVTHIHNGHNDNEHHGDSHGEHGHSFEEDLGHGFHKASITILGILVIETFLKIFCVGSRFFKHRLEVFDGFIVIGSFILDLVFIKGLSVYKIQDYVFILAFLVPWRVIRVVNSLVVAVMDHEHFRLKLLYKQKKEISGQLKDSKIEMKNLKHCLESLEKLCKGAGVSEVRIQQHLAFLRRNKKKKTLSSFASITFNTFKQKDTEELMHSNIKLNDIDKNGEIRKITADVNVDEDNNDKTKNGDAYLHYEDEKNQKNSDINVSEDDFSDGENFVDADADIPETSDLIHSKV